MSSDVDPCEVGLLLERAQRVDLVRVPLLWAVAVRKLPRANACDSFVILRISGLSNCGSILITAAEFLLASRSGVVVDEVVGVDPRRHR